MNNDITPLPKKLLQEMESVVRAGTWRIIRLFKAQNRDRIPDWCYIPQYDLMRLVVEHGLLPLHHMVKATVPLFILSAWRTTQGMYRFAPNLLARLTKAPLIGEIPVEGLQLLPEWCVYIDLPEPVLFSGKTFYGFFATTSPSLGGVPHLCLGWLGRGRTDFDIDELPLTGTLEQSIQHMMNTGIGKKARAAVGTPFSRLDEEDRQDLRARFGFALPILLYLASVNAEIRSRHGNQSQPEKRERLAVVKKGKHKVPGPRVWDVGWRHGASLPRIGQGNGDEADRGGTHRSPRPHIRSAHFHHYWVGSKSDPKGRRLILKWLEPIEVNVEDSGELVPTVKEVASF
jgi:hypothetical protein